MPKSQTLTRDDHRVLDLVSAGNVFRQGPRDVRRGREDVVTVDTNAVIRAGLVYLKPNGRLGLTRVGKKVRDERIAGEQDQT